MNDSSRTTNAKRNILYGILQVIVSQVLPFIVRTILIYRFGVNYLGLNTLFASVLSVLSLMELGFGTAIVFSLYKPVAENDVDQICAYLAYYRKIYRIIGVAILVSGIILMPFLKYLIHDPSLPGNLNLYICYLIFLVDAVLSYLLYGYLTAIPVADQRRDVLSKVDIGISLFKSVIQSIILLFFNSFYIYLFSIPLITIVRNLITASVIRRRYPKLVCMGELSVDQKNDLRNKVHGIVIEKITAISRNSIDTLCISTFIGLAACGIYNNYYFVMAGIVAFSTIILNSMMAGVGNSIAVETKEKNYSDMRMFDFIYTSIAGWATVCLLCLYQPFMFTWLGNGMMLEIPVVLGLCSYFYILKSADIRWVYHEGAGIWFESRFIMLGEAVLNIVLNIALCKFLGIFGIILATVISVFITNAVFCPKLLFKLYFQNNKFKEYCLDHICYTCTMLLSATISWFANNTILPLSMISNQGIINCILFLGGRLLICSIIVFSVFWLIWHATERYAKAMKWIRKIV